MAALDSRLALALMAKAERVFGAPGQVLAFPLGGTSYRAAQLNFLPAAADADGLRTALAGLSGFSALVNTLPLGQAFLAEAGRADLPQVYRHVLEQAEVAALEESQADRQALAAARALLVNRNLDGSEVDTPVYADYKRCRDLWLLASQQYNAARLSGELGSDEAAKQAWQINEPVLKAALDEAADEWRLDGHKEEVEAALAQIATLTQRAPVTQWHDWELRSRPGTGSLTDLTGQPFWPAYISPANACEVGWQQMVLNRGEVEALQAGAPPEMKARLGAGAAPLELDQLQFEYTSAKLQRPWFDAQVLTSRFWRTRQGDPLRLSEGHEPWTGACPLYASAVVFFRRIRAVVKGEAAASQALAQAGGGLDIGLIKPTWHAKDAAALIVEREARVGMSDLAGADELPGRRADMRRSLAGIRRPHDLRTETAGLMGEAASLAQAPGLGEPEPVVGDGMIRPRGRFAERALLDTHLILREADWAPPPLQAPAPPAAGHSVLATDDEDIFILAFVCNVVPASPDPDPALVWPPSS